MATPATQDAPSVGPRAGPALAVFIQRLFTAYLPPIWGWVTLA